MYIYIYTYIPPACTLPLLLLLLLLFFSLPIFFFSFFGLLQLHGSGLLRVPAVQERRQGMEHNQWSLSVMVMVQHGTISVAVKQVTRRHIKAASTVTRLGAAPTSTLAISMYGQPLPLRVASCKTQANKRHAQGGAACLLV